MLRPEPGFLQGRQVCLTVEPFSLFSSKIYFYFYSMCMVFCQFIYLCTIYVQRPERGCLSLWNWSYRYFWAIMSHFEPEFSGRAVLLSAEPLTPPLTTINKSFKKVYRPAGVSALKQTGFERCNLYCLFDTCVMCWVIGRFPKGDTVRSCYSVIEVFKSKAWVW